MNLQKSLRNIVVRSISSHLNVPGKKFEKIFISNEELEKEIIGNSNIWATTILQVEWILGKGWGLLDNGPQQNIFSNRRFKTVAEWLKEKKE